MFSPSPNLVVLPRTISPPTFHGNRIDRSGLGLRGAQGADVIVTLLRTSRSVRHLILGHNALEDAGCTLLFEYLRSEAGRRHQITEISLNTNNIGDEGLWAIARYLEDNQSLIALFLQNNSFQGNGPIMLRFTLSVNRSNLQTLSLTCNLSLANAISTTFLPNLSAPRLSELHLSVCSLGPAAAPALLTYLKSPHSLGLHVLHLNGNPLGFTTIIHIVNLLERANWSIGRLEIHACSRDGPADDNGWNILATHLRVRVLERNRFLRKKVEEEALDLLPCARALLLKSKHPALAPSPRLPPELLLHILSFVAPSLSTAQHLRVSTYAASLDTLPPLGLTLPYTHWHSPSLSRFTPQHTCVVDKWDFPGDPSRSCAARVRKKRATSPLREQQRSAWLRHVGCDRFEAAADPPETESEESAEIQ